MALDVKTLQAACAAHPGLSVDYNALYQAKDAGRGRLHCIS